ncbi:hypothetical protein Vretifemale_15187, partial [Volvox reticuliferus]
MPTTVIIGAGISGLQCASAFLRLGHTVTVLEREEDVGGVWLRYTAFEVQVPREFFSFPDFACPPELEPEEYPNGRSLLRYIIAYAHKNQLYRHIVFRATVTRLHRLSGQWQCFFDVRTGGPGREAGPGGSAGANGGGGGGGGVVVQQHRITADFVVVATGLHSSPHMPLFDGHHLFRGQVLHAQDLPDSAAGLSQLVSGRRVLLVGASKTAVDTATRVSAAGAEDTVVVYRQAHWPISRYPFRGVHFTQLLHSRLAASMLDPYYDAGLCARAKGWLTRPLRRLFWRTLERSLIRQQHLSGDLLPTLPLDKDLLTGGLVHDGKWLQCLQDGTVRAVRGEPQRFTADGLVLRSGDFIAADVVVMATGHVKDYSFIDADILSKLGVQRDGLYLYRHVLPPLVRNIAFVGTANSLNNPLTSYLQIKWLVACLQQRVRLPEPHEMLRDMQRQTRWQRRKLPPQADRASMIGIYSHYYHDRLLKDMGLRTHRKRNLLRECFEPYTTADYQDLAESAESEGQWQPTPASAPMLAPEMSMALGSSFKLSAEPSAASPSELYDVTPAEHSVGFGFMPSMRRGAAPSRGSTATDTAAAAAAAVAAAGLTENEIGPAEAEARWVTMSGAAVPDHGPAGSTSGPSTAPPILMPSLSYRSGAGQVVSTRLLTLYEQEALNGRVASALRSGPALARVGVSSAALTPPETPMNLMSPVSYGAGFRSVGRPALYVPPSSGRSCLMDAAALAMMDGVIGGALLDNPPNLSPQMAAAAAAAGTATATATVTVTAAGQHPKPLVGSGSSGDVPASTTAPSTASGMRSSTAAAAAAAVVTERALGEMRFGVTRARTAPAATTMSPTMMQGSGSGREPNAGGVTASGGGGGPGATSTSVVAVSAAAAAAAVEIDRGESESTSDEDPTTRSGPLVTEDESSSAEVIAARVLPFDFEASAASGCNGGNADGGGVSHMGGPRGLSAPFMTPVLAAALAAAAGSANMVNHNSVREVSMSTLEVANGWGDGGSDGCGGGRAPHDETEAAATPAGLLAVPPNENVFLPCRLGEEEEEEAPGPSSAGGEAPASNAESNPEFQCRTRSNSRTNSTADGHGAQGGNVGRSTPPPLAPRSLVRLAMAHHQQATTGAAATDAPSTLTADSTISRPSSNGSVHAIAGGAVRIGSSSVGPLRASRRISDFFDESDEFVGTPPSCFDGSMEALAVDRDRDRDRDRDGRGSRSCTVMSLRQRRSQRYPYNGDDTDDYDNEDDDFDEEYVYIGGMDNVNAKLPVSAPQGR